MPEAAAPGAPAEPPREVWGGSWQAHCVRGLQTSGAVTKHREFTAAGAARCRGAGAREILLLPGLAGLGSGGQSTRIVWEKVTGEQGRKGQEVEAGAMLGPAGRGRVPAWAGASCVRVGQEKGGQLAEWGARVREDPAVVLGGLSEGALGVWAEPAQPCLVLQPPPLAEDGQRG